MGLKMIDPRIIDIIRRVTKNPDIAPETIKDPFTVLGWDSLKSIEILLEIQEVFGIEVEPYDILRIKDLGDLQKLIHDKQEKM
jgi:acyl carrier protein